MGRGRAKAKQTKVARELKYRSPNTDFTSLERELRGDPDYEVPQAYADLASPSEDEDADYYEDDRHLRKSG